MRIVGDDLTGTAEAAAAFAAPGRPVVLRLRARARRPSHSGVEALDLNVRDAARATVTARYARAAARSGPADELYVKVDSALRGPIREALAGIAQALPDRLLVVAPAFPDVGRTVRGTVVHVDGAPLARTEMWAHEPLPAPASVLEVLPREPDAVLDVAAIARGELTEALRREGSAASLIVCDATENVHLAQIASGARAAGRPVVWVGSAGLARAIAPAPGNGPRGPLPMPFLAVIGSSSPPALAQVDALRAAGARCFALDPEQLRRAGEAAARSAAASIADAASRENVVVSVASDAVAPVSRSRRVSLARALARLVAPALEVTALGVLVGGATARAILTAAGLESLEVAGELRAGVVASVAGARRLSVITKPGSFGGAAVLADILSDAGAR